MELQQVRAFVAVAREGSVSRAAKKLFRTQPTVTLALQKLEREIGHPLTERFGRGIRLTAGGRMLFEELAPLLERWEAAPELLRRAKGSDLAGPLRFAGDDSALRFLLPGPLRAFLKRHPRVRVLMRQESPLESAALVRQEQSDLALVPAATPLGDLSSRPAFASDRVLLVPGSHPMRAAARVTLPLLSRYPLLLSPKNTETRRAVDAAFDRAALAPQVALEDGGWEVLLRYAGLGLGVAVLPAFCLERADRRFAVRPAKHLFGHERYVVVWKGAAPHAAAAADFVRLMPRGSGASR